MKGLENYTNAAPRSPINRLSYRFRLFTANPITIEVTDRLPVMTEGFNNNTGAEAYRSNPESVGPGFPEGAGIFTFVTYPAMLTNVGGVFITLPTAEIYINSLDFTVAYTGDVYAHTAEPITFLPGFGAHDLYVGPMGALTSHAINDNQGWLIYSATGTAIPKYPLEGDFGSIFMRGITFTQLSGWMEIAPH